MFVVAVGCVVAGTWQISRYEQTARTNRILDANAHAATVPLSTALVPLVGHGPTPSREAIRFRTVTVSGTYVPSAQQLVRDQSVLDHSGYYVLTPLRTADGIVLVVRGFVPDGGDDVVPATIAAAPTGPVQLTGRLQTGSSTNDGATELTDNEIESVNPREQAVRLDAPVYNGYLTLNDSQAGTAGLTVLPAPDLSNPAGGAVEPQHLAYVIQWYLFALLALAAPFLIARHEVREAQKQFLGIDPSREDFTDDVLALDGAADQLELPAGPGGALVRRNSGTLAVSGEPTAEEWERAARMADRYGRSLGVGKMTTGLRRAAPRSPVNDNGYHDSYNDYLWELAMSDGAAPDVVVPNVIEAEPSDGPVEGTEEPTKGVTE